MHTGVQLDVDFYRVVGGFVEGMGVGAVDGGLDEIVGGEQMDLVRGGVAQYQDFSLDSVQAQFYALLNRSDGEGADA